MSRIEKLWLSGIRSFGQEDEDVQEISFVPPLTLILGQNGCGKTTIIESLKYITTGEMPPGCGRGASFIHDPKITREPVVKGKIRLRVRTSRGERVDFVKCMEAIQKPRTIEFKSLDQCITRIGPDGLKRQASNKCVDFLHEMIDVMGVSKPILENVIFCHQEESNWPLDESKKVKDKFDAIFNATKYIKCLDTIRKLRASKKTEVRAMQDTLASLQDMKMVAENKRADLSTQQEQLQDIKVEQEQLLLQKAPVLRRIREIEEVENRLAEVSKDLGRKESRITMLRENNERDTEEQTQVIDCTDEELHRRIAEYLSTLSLKKTQIHKVERLVSDADKDLQLLSARHTVEFRNLTKLETEHEQHEARVTRRDAAIEAIVRGGTIPDLQVYNNQSQFSEGDADAAVTSLTEYIKREEERVEVRCAEMLKDEEELQASLNTCRAREAALNEEVRGLEARVSQLSASARKAELEEARLGREVKQCDREKLTADLRSAEEQLREREAAFDEEQVRAELDQIKTRRSEAARQVEQLKAQLSAMNRQAALRAELAVHTKEADEMAKKITLLFRKNKDTLDGIMPGEFSEETLKEKYDNYSKQLQSELAGNKSNLEKLRERRSRNQISVDSLRKQQEEKEKEVKDLETRITAVCSDLTLDEALSKKKEQVDGLQRETGELESTKTVMERYIEKLTVEDCCPLCHRDFAQQEENRALREELRGRLTSLPLRLRGARERRAVAEKQYNALLQLQPYRDQLQQLQARLRQIQSDLTRPLTELSELNREVEDLELTVNMCVSDVQLCLSLQEDVVAADTHAKTRRKLLDKCDDIRARLGEQDGNEGVESVNSRLTEAETSLSSICTEQEERQTAYMRCKDELHDLRTSYNRLAQQEIEVQTKQQAVERKQEEVRRLHQEREVEQQRRDERKELLPPARRQVQQMQEKKTAATQARMQYSKEEAAKVEKSRNLLRPLSSLQSNISSYLSSNSVTRLASARAEVERLKQELQDKQKVKKAYEDQHRALEKELFEQKDYERNLNIEKKVRERKNQIENLLTEVEILMTKLASAEQESLTTEKSKLSRKYQDLEKKYNLANGRAEEVQKRVTTLEAELHLPQYREAVNKYRAKMFHIKCTEVACQDLDKYYTALDSAIMRFHAQKMKTINSIIHRLWITTYRGNDVDRIEIKTDETESRGSDKRRTYNYRVVMYKRGAEMDMRGRCSAGQKVLASLIIRMALAETFSKNCGILALDEPTTNLDRDNIESLILALVGIVNQRSQQRNFQLIVITHDDDFLRGLSRADHIRDYYRVSRDRRGLSCISRVGVSDNPR